MASGSTGSSTILYGGFLSTLIVCNTVLKDVDSPV